MHELLELMFIFIPFFLFFAWMYQAINYIGINKNSIAKLWLSFIFIFLIFFLIYTIAQELYLFYKIYTNWHCINDFLQLMTANKTSNYTVNETINTYIKLNNCGKFIRLKI